MGIGRWAGEALQAYQGKWNEAVTAGLRPIDRLVASDSDRLSGVATGMAPHLVEQVRSRPSEPMSGKVLEQLQQLDPTGDMANVFSVMDPDTGVSAAAREIYSNLDNPDGHGINDVARSLIYQSADKRKIGGASVRKMIEAGVVPDSFLMTKGAQAARDSLSNGVAAYGLPAAGVGLAAWGIHDVMAAQQRAEKEGQLPVQGGVQ